MSNDPVPRSATANLVYGTQTPKPATVKVVSGKDAGALEAAARQPSQPVGTPATTTNRANLPQLVAQLNKYLNDSGRPNQFRVDPTSSGKTIQEINPASGEVIGEYSVAQFPELARSLGVSGVLVDSRA
jgi:hypothetical protein